MDINKLAIVEGDDVYYTKGFMDVLEAHMQYLRKSHKSTSYTVDKDIAHIYQGDLYSYLNFRGIAQRLHWITMRMNGYYSSFEFKPTVDYLIVPSSKDIELIRLSYINGGLVNF
jgi:trehalose-6-phosphate synthase